MHHKVLSMNKENYLKDLNEIRGIMEKSTRFITLSGLSGVSAGIIALFGALLAYKTVYNQQDYLGYRQASLDAATISTLLSIAAGTLILAAVSVIYFTRQKARKEGQRIWSVHVQRLLINMAIPLVTGGILCLMLLVKGYIGLIAPLTLLFYGLALVHASKYTMETIRSLGILQIVLGLVATWFIGYGLIFWAVGFGLLHIVYGIYMHIVYR